MYDPENVTGNMPERIVELDVAPEKSCIHFRTTGLTLNAPPLEERKKSALDTGIKTEDPWSRYSQFKIGTVNPGALEKLGVELLSSENEKLQVPLGATKTLGATKLGNEPDELTV